MLEALAIPIGALSVLLFAGTLWLLLYPHRVECAFRLRAPDDGPWSIAGAARYRWLRVTFAFAEPGMGVYGVTLGKRRLLQGKLPPEGGPGSAHRASKLDEALKQLDPLEVFFLVLDWATRFRYEKLAIHVECGSADPMVLGQVSAATAVLSGLLTPVGRLTSSIDWLAESESLELSLDANLRVAPGGYLRDLIRFVFSQIRVWNIKRRDHVQFDLRRRKAIA